MISFRRFVIENFLGQDTPEGDFAMDINADKEFPRTTPKDGYEIKWYLQSKRACDECIDIFEELWRVYKLKKLYQKRATDD